MHVIDIINIREIIAFRERKEPEFRKGGDMTYEELSNMSTFQLKELIADYQEGLLAKAKALTDILFKKYAEPEDNIIIIGGAYVPERKAYEIEEPLRSIDFEGFNHDYNKLFYPIGRNWDLSTYYPEHQGADDDKYDAFYEEADNLRELLLSLDIPSPEEYWENDNEALNEYWYGCIGIMKDYRVVSFVIRDDGMLCDEDSLDSFHNHIIKEL